MQNRLIDSGTSKSPHKRVVIVGGGFAGIQVAKKLCNERNVEITLIDARNHHLFQPLLYQVATAALSPAEISYPIRSVLTKCKNTRVLLAKVVDLNLDAKTIQLEDGAFENYDYLIVACGAGHHYFNHPEWEPHAPGLKTLEQATEIRRRILSAFEQAERELNLDRQREWQTFVIVGAGPTGVEMAGAIAEISRFTLGADFRRIVPERTRIILVEAGPRILPQFDESLARKATRDLEQLGVQIWTTTRVTNIDENGVELGNEKIRARNVIWSAGVAPSSLAKKLGVPLDKLGRVLVEKDLSLAQHPEVFVIGDMAAAFDKNGQSLPGIAPVAIQEGAYVAKTIRRELLGQARIEFAYQDKGMMATIGRKKAIVQIGKFKFSGLFAWYLWLFVHIYYLIGFRNRVFVFFQWWWSYATFSRGARLILNSAWHTKDTKDTKDADA